MHHSSLLQNAYVHKPRLHPEPRQSYINGTAISSTVGHLHASPWFKNTSAFLPSPLYNQAKRSFLFPPLFPPSLAHLPCSFPLRRVDRIRSRLLKLFPRCFVDAGRKGLVQLVYTRERSYEFVNKSRGIIETFIFQSLFLWRIREWIVDVRNSWIRY